MRLDVQHQMQRGIERLKLVLFGYDLEGEEIIESHSQIFRYTKIKTIRPISLCTYL